MNKKILIICSLLFGTSLSAWGSETPLSVDLSSVAQMTLERNLEIQAAKQDKKTAELVVHEAAGYQKGKVGVAAQYLHLDRAPSISSPAVNFMGMTIAVPPVKAAPQELLHLTLQAGYPLYNGGKIKSAIQQANIGVSAQDALITNTESEKVYQSSEYYLGALLANELVKVNQSALEAYQKHLENARIAYQKGVVAEYDVIRAETAVQSQMQKVTEAQNRYALALAALKTVLYLDKETPIELKGSFFDVRESLILPDAQKKAEENSAILKALTEQANAYQTAEKVEKADKKPQVNAISEYEIIQNHKAYTDPDWFVGVQASMDLFDGGVRKSKIDQQRSNYQKVNLQKENAKDQIRLALQSAFLDMDSARSALATSRKAEELAQESLRLAGKRFDVGAGTSLEVLDANVTLQAAQVSEYSSLYQLDLAYLKLHRYLDDISVVSTEVQK